MPMPTTQTDDAPTPPTTRVVDAERRLLDPAVRADPAAVERLLHPDFTEIGASGRLWTRTEILDAMRDWEHTPVVTTEFTASPLSDGLIQLTYLAEGTHGRTRRSSIWQCDDSEWRIRFHQGTAAERIGSEPADDWDRRVASVWDDADDIGHAAVLDRIRTLVSQRPDEPRAAYELASAHDFAGEEAEAIEHYERALAGGLDDARRPQAVIQLASSLRNIGRAEDAVTTLETEDLTDTEYASASRGFLALALTDAERPREAVGTAVRALGMSGGPYARALTAYAEELGTTRSDELASGGTSDGTPI